MQLMWSTREFRVLAGDGEWSWVPQHKMLPKIPLCSHEDCLRVIYLWSCISNKLQVGIYLACHTLGSCDAFRVVATVNGAFATHLVTRRRFIEGPSSSVVTVDSSKLRPWMLCAVHRFFSSI